MSETKTRSTKPAVGFRNGCPVDEDGNVTWVAPTQLLTRYCYECHERVTTGSSCPETGLNH